MTSIIKFLLAAILICSFSYSKAQDTIAAAERPDFKRHEINIGFANLFNRIFPETFYLMYSDYYNDDYYYEYGYYPFPFYDMDYSLQKFGMGYKFHFRESAIRSYFDIGYDNSDFSDESESSSSAKTKTEGSSMVSSYTARLGYELHKNVKSTQFFFGLDAFTQASDYEWQYESKTTYIDGNQRTTSYENKRKYTAFGGSPILGIKYHFNEQVSISTETRFNFTSYNDKSSYNRETTDLFYPFNSSESEGASKGDGFKIKMSPLGLFSLNVHF